MEKEEKLLLAQAEDKARQRNNRNILTHTGFLSMAEQALLEHTHPDGTFYGGYEDAEQCMLVFLPDWLTEIPAEDGPVCVLRVTLPKGAPKLTHRDYLGSLLALGVERSVIGDILVQEDGADILVSAVGKPHFVTADMVKPGAVVVDVGINRVDGKVIGDVELEQVKEIAGWITPVPGGVGRMTIAMLLSNTADAAERTLNRE